MALTAVLVALGAVAQAEQVVTVTGSRLSAAQDETPAPVQVITRDDIARSGAGSLREVIDQLAISAGGSSDIGGSASFAAGSSGASLRSLGKQATLILLNGRRVAPYPLADYAEVFTNIDALPFEAVDRIEVLKIGGAAQYGSDAVAGVINVITRHGWEGQHLRASHQQSVSSGRFGNSTVSLSRGFRTGTGQASEWLLNVELYHREGVTWDEVLAHVRPEAWQRSPGFGTPSSFSWPGNIVGSGPLPGCASSQLARGLCFYNRYERFEVVPAAQRANLLLSGQVPLDAGHRLFSELLLASTRTDYRSPFQAYGPALGTLVWGNPATNGVNSFTQRGLPAGHPLNPLGEDDVDFRYRFVDGPSESQARTLQLRALAGLAGRSGTWDWEAAAGLMGGRTRFDQQGWYSLSGFREVIGNDDPSQVDPQFFNRAYRIGQPNSPEVLARLFPRYHYRGQVQQAFADARTSGSLTQWSTGPVRAAAGVDIRHERFTVTPSQTLRDGDIVGNGVSASDGSRWTGAVFAELELPLRRDLQAQLAARVDQFGRMAAHASPKLGLRWQALPALVLRATGETGFRAPNLTETHQSTKFAFDNGVNDPQRCPQALRLADDLRAQAAAAPAGDSQAAVLTARADQVQNAECGAAVASAVIANADLRPETSRSASLGLVLAPARAWKLSVDAWAIERRDEIGLQSTRELLSVEADRPSGEILRAALDANDRSFRSAEQARYGVTRGALTTTVGRFRNQGRTQTRGVDVQAQSRHALPWGALHLTLDASYLVAYKAWSDTAQRWGDNLAGRSGHPRWNAVAGATWLQGPWEAGLRAVARSASALRGDFYDTAYTDEGCANSGYTPQECRSAGWVRWDAHAAWTVYPGLQLNLQVHNLFNRRMPVVWANWNGISPPQDEDARGRMLRVTLTWRL